MKSFLEYVAHRLMGKPVSGSCWPCPFCDSPQASFYVRPPKPPHKVRFKCYRCGEWGDEFDLRKLFFDKEDFSQRSDRLDQWRQDYEREGYSYRGEGSTQTVNPKQHIQSIHYTDARCIEMAWADLIEVFRDEETGDELALQIVNQFADHASRNNVSMEALLPYWRASGFRSIQAKARSRFRHLTYSSWPKAAQDEFGLACASEEVENMRILCPRDPQDPEKALTSLLETFHDEGIDETFAFQVFETCRTCCDRYGVSMEAILAYWNDFEQWAVESDERHRAECDDHECDARACRVARGLDPLTTEEIDEGRRERMLAKQKQDERIRRALRGVRSGRV